MTDPADDIRARFGAFVRDAVNPGASHRDRAGEPLSRDLVTEAARLGLLGYGLPTDIGGGGADDLAWGLLLEEIGYLSDDLSLPQVLFAATIPARAILATGRADSFDRYVRPVAT